MIAHDPAAPNSSSTLPHADMGRRAPRRARRQGPIATALIAAAASIAFAASSAQAVIFVVNSVADAPDAMVDGICDTGNLIPNGSGGLEVECTLRAAILEAESTAARDHIHFSSDLIYGVRGTATIDVPSNFQNLDNPIDITGFTAPSWETDDYPRVRLRGPGLANGVDGFRLRQGASTSTIKGLAFQGFRYAVTLAGADDVIVDGCSFGYWAEPSVVGQSIIPAVDSVLANTNGIRVESDSTGTDIGERVISTGPNPDDLTITGIGNVISGNTYGIVNHGLYTTVIGNAIGIGLDGDRFETFALMPRENIGNDYGLWITNLGGLRVGTLIYPASQGAVKKGNVISNNEYHGVYVDENTQVAGTYASFIGNQIGTDLTGLTARGNRNRGVMFQNARTQTYIGFGLDGGNVIATNDWAEIHMTPGVLGPITIEGNEIGLSPHSNYSDITHGIVTEGGEPLTIRNNVLGGLPGNGIEVSGPASAPTRDVTIENNQIAADPTLRNAGCGVVVDHAAEPSVRITSNTIGANYCGILLGTQSGGVKIQSNFIGTDSNGTNLANVTNGITSLGTKGGHTIGGTRASEGNVIGWSIGNGIWISNGDTRSTIRNNQIGVDGWRAIPNGQSGITVSWLGPSYWSTPPSEVVIGSDLGPSGWDVDNHSNEIKHNGHDGVTVEGHGWAVIRGNEIADNQEIGIDLGNDGASPNDSSDWDYGANLMQNSPEIDAAASSWDPQTDQITVRYKVDSQPGDSAYDLRIDFYLADATGTQPEEHLGEDLYPDFASREFRTIGFAPNPFVPIPSDAYLVATATDANGRTSEVSAPVYVPEPNFAFGLAASVMALSLGRRR